MEHLMAAPVNRNEVISRVGARSLTVNADRAGRCELEWNNPRGPGVSRTDFAYSNEAHWTEVQANIAVDHEPVNGAQLQSGRT